MKTKVKFILAGAFALLFACLIILVLFVDVGAICPEDRRIGLSGINKAFHDLTGVNMIWYKITEALGFLAVGVCALFALIGCIQFIKRKSLLKVDREIFALAGLYIFVIGLYILFETVIVNYRPIIMPGDTNVEASFPSSHTMLIITVMGSAFLTLGKYVENRTARIFLQAVCIILTVLTVVGRLICGVHWLTDIIGGVLISACLISLFSAVTDRICVNDKEKE